jgi:methylenetetrahydrofolate dehydrogenase (NADP+)/methenyltetrahydrofolate cyclohydrolase
MAETYQLLDGKKAAEALREEIAHATVGVKEKLGRAPHLAAVLVGGGRSQQDLRSQQSEGLRQGGFPVNVGEKSRPTSPKRSCWR